MKIIGYFCVVFAIIMLLFVMYRNSKYSDNVPSFSSYTLLSSSWEKYKTQFINKDGRVLDPDQNNVTTSEGQSYAMLRSVWIDDPETFDLVWEWTKNTLRRPTDDLFGWRWGKRNDANYGFIENGGDNASSDADSDIALALILASRRWNNPSYLEEAKKILPDMWDVETASVLGKRYLIAGNWAQNETSIILNPSYFAPYAWRVFATVDTDRDWLSLVDPAYEVLEQASRAHLDKNGSSALPPDWVALDRSSGTLLAPSTANLTTNFSYDAMRVPWRVALDYQWNNAQIARDYLDSMCKKLADEYRANERLGSVYAHNGDLLQGNESPAMYGTTIGCFISRDAPLARKMYEEKIVRLYSNEQNTFDPRLGYYEQNWLWFGAALYNNHLSQF